MSAPAPVPAYNIRFVIEYDGSHFHGWQLQKPGVRTGHSELRRALSLILGNDVHPIHASGRTDAGVHARGQVVNFSLPFLPDLPKLSFGVSGILRGKIAVLSADVVPNDFHARDSALRKQYSYQIVSRNPPPVIDWGKVWHVRRHPNIEIMQSAANALVGEHDFSSFRAAGCSANSPVRKIFESRVTVKGATIEYTVVGSGFLRNMVRIIVGTLVDLGTGTIPGSMQEIMDARNRGRAGVTAPPQGLYLDWVEYP
jgi:tRNA pseudouridine38-40 synthase